MSRTFLKPEHREKAVALLVPPAKAPDGKANSAAAFPSAGFSEWLLENLLNEWKSFPDFESAGPILVGSASRGELCPKSDLDLLFSGSEESVASFVRRSQEKGLRVRSRVPENRDDWTVGVEVPDVLALLEAKPLTNAANEALRRQQQILSVKRKTQRRSWLNAILKERKERETRFDSIANVLEPNLKYGPGGLRDLDQARQIYRLFPERFAQEQTAHALEVLSYYAEFWTTLRQKLHLEGHGDILTSAAQFDLARWLGMEHKSFMREVQRGLTRVHFYSQWISERARVSEKKWSEFQAKPMKTREQAMQLLEKDPSVLMQEKIRHNLDSLFPKSWMTKEPKERGHLLEKMLRPGAPEDFIAGVFGSRLIDRLCPEIKPLIGYTQHDQYHRYTADIHLQQACREFQRTLAKPNRLGVLASEVRELNSQDRKILSWAVLYHDLMKGREGDHSLEGRRLVRKDLKSFGHSESFSQEVEWLVEHHLELSLAAFRKNPMSPATWNDLRAIGAEGARLRRLAVFTAVDIFATNPEAWTSWKARLMFDLLKAIRSPSAQSLFKLKSALEKRKVPDVSGELDGYLLMHLPTMKLADDLEELAKSAKKDAASMPPKILSVGKNEIWIRFHSREDRAGLFAEYVQRLYSFGLGIRHAAVHTLPELGVYDWFQITSRKPVAQVRKWFEAGETPVKAPPQVKFESVSLVSEDTNEWVFSFKGLDQPGCLAAAAKALADEGMSLRSARVHTWGRQVDDLFHVQPKGQAQDVLAKLRTRFQLG